MVYPERSKQVPKYYSFLLILWSLVVLLLQSSDLFGLWAVRLDYLDYGQRQRVLMLVVAISMVFVPAKDSNLSLVQDLKVRWVEAVVGFLQVWGRQAFCPVLSVIFTPSQISRQGIVENCRSPLLLQLRSSSQCQFFLRVRQKVVILRMFLIYLCLGEEFLEWLCRSQSVKFSIIIFGFGLGGSLLNLGYYLGISNFPSQSNAIFLLFSSSSLSWFCNSSLLRFSASALSPSSFSLAICSSYLFSRSILITYISVSTSLPFSFLIAFFPSSIFSITACLKSVLFSIYLNFFSLDILLASLALAYTPQRSLQSNSYCPSPVGLY